MAFCSLRRCACSADVHSTSPSLERHSDAFATHGIDYAGAQSQLSPATRVHQLKPWQLHPLQIRTTSQQQTRNSRRITPIPNLKHERAPSVNLTHTLQTKPSLTSSTQTPQSLFLTKHSTFPLITASKSSPSHFGHGSKFPPYA